MIEQGKKGKGKNPCTSFNDSHILVLKAIGNIYIDHIYKYCAIQRVTKLQRESIDCVLNYRYY